MVALDASALIAFLLREPGAEVVRVHLAAACISAVNIAEVLARFARDGIDTDVSAAAIGRLGIEQVPFTPDDAERTAELIARTRSAGLSLGDCACLALATSRGIPALTTDRAWQRLKLGAQVDLIR